MTYDIVLDPNSFELQAGEDGDFLLGETSNNNIKSIVLSNPGDWKEFPLVGVGIYGSIQAITNAAKIEQSIIKQLKEDNGNFPNPLVNARNFPSITVNAVKIELPQ